MELSKEVVLAVITTGEALQQRLDTALGHIKGITFSEYRLLSSIADGNNNATSRVDLARSVAMTASGVTRALRPLEKLGMVDTVRDTRDARRSLASLTADGQELLADARGVIADAIADFQGVQDLTADQASELLAALSKLGR